MIFFSIEYTTTHRFPFYLLQWKKKCGSSHREIWRTCFEFLLMYLWRFEVYLQFFSYCLLWSTIMCEGKSLRGYILGAMSGYVRQSKRPSFSYGLHRGNQWRDTGWTLFGCSFWIGWAWYIDTRSISPKKYQLVDGIRWGAGGAFFRRFNELWHESFFLKALKLIKLNNGH